LAFKYVTYAGSPEFTQALAHANAARAQLEADPVTSTFGGAVQSAPSSEQRAVGAGGKFAQDLEENQDAIYARAEDALRFKTLMEGGSAGVA
jgi:hypothetical protein